MMLSIDEKIIGFVSNDGSTMKQLKEMIKPQAAETQNGLEDEILVVNSQV